MTSTRQVLVALLSAALCSGVVDASNRDLSATNIIEDISIPYNAATVGTDPLNQLSFSDPRVQRTVSGLAPEQIHLTYLSDTQTIVSWATGYGNTTVGDSTYGLSSEYNFTSPPKVGNTTYPFVLGVVADPGLTINTTVTIQHLVDANPQVWTLLGDFTYADDMQTNGTTSTTNGSSLSYVPSPEGTYQPWWDLWFRYYSNAIASRIPLLPNHGNHELEPQYLATYASGLANNTQFQSYVSRNPTSIVANARSCLVQPPDYPLVDCHFPCPLILIICVSLQGERVHEYERSNPVYNFTVNECGAVHITMGDGGKFEGLYKTFADTAGLCPTPNKTVPAYQPGGYCPTYVYDGNFCASSQPSWSAFREPAYGHGILTFENSTHAYWQWNRNLDNENIEMDTVYVIRQLSCSNKAGY
ncbi:hypothetical protein WJX82_001035 [Trebouxia sp. C0006]